MIFHGLRTFLDALESHNELVRVTMPVDPFLEITEIADRVMKRDGPALLFEKVKGSSFPLVINAFGSQRRMKLALGIEDIESIGEDLSALLTSLPPASLGEKLQLLLKLHQIAKIFPRLISGPAPCQQVIMEKPNLDRLPILTCWPEDGGPFITLPIVITKDPETGRRNCGMYRLQKFSSTTTGLHWQVHKDARRIFNRYKTAGRRMEVAVALGGDPVLTYAATAPFPPEMDELVLAGFIKKRGIDLIPGVTVDIEVPADADFIIEGYVNPDEEFKAEGPFGDHTGFYTPVEQFPVFHVTAITHRKDPVYPATIVGIPPKEDAYFGWVTERIFLPLLKVVFPEIVDIHLPVEGGFHNLAIVSIKKSYPGQGTKIMQSLWGMGQMMLTKCLIVVENDIDIHDLRQLSWYVLSSMDPKRDFTVWQGPLDQLDHASNHALYGGKIGIDATKKWKEEGYMRTWPEMITMDREVVKRIDAIWRSLGIET
ncbi:MAG: menaquinone biosynthesis decarboxylase [Deltaproteobacteria bacterium]|nr:menaquinone biosynthesis decarboxylase [Deltaproteobacteria bacterium]